MPLVTAGEHKTEARRLQRLAGRGELRRIYPGIYTDDLLQPLDSIVCRELLSLCSLIAHGSIISHRTALEGCRPTPGGSVFLTGPNRRDFELPGLKLRMIRGAAPLDSDTRVPTFFGDTFVSSQARALLENLTASRGPDGERRTLGANGVEDWLDRFIRRDVSGATNTLRDSARRISTALELEEEFNTLDAMIGALLGTRKARLNAPAALARAAGKPYDVARVALFQTLAEELQRNPLQVPLADPRGNFHVQAFMESYFSNFIEGTEFELDEAHDIVVRGRPLKYREDDSHDILGTYRAILQSKTDPITPQSFEAFARQLQEWNRQVIESRHAKNPGEFKTDPNRAGGTEFVAPDLVVGTLGKGYETIMSAATPENRAALAMFVVSEVHPFTDGNGRTTRLATNLFLSHAGLTRILIPTVYRDDYITALRAMSSNALPEPLGRMLGRAARFSRWLDTSSKESAFAAVQQSNALRRPNEARLVFDEAPPAVRP